MKLQLPVLSSLSSAPLSSHLQTPDLVQVLLQPAVHLPHQIPVLHDDAPLLRLCSPQAPHQLLFAPLQQLLVVDFGDILRWTLYAFGQLLLLLCAFLHPLNSRGDDRGRKSTVSAEFQRKRNQTKPSQYARDTLIQHDSGSPRPPSLRQWSHIALLQAAPPPHAHAAAPCLPASLLPCPRC